MSEEDAHYKIGQAISIIAHLLENDKPKAMEAIAKKMALKWLAVNFPMFETVYPFLKEIKV